MAKTTNTKIKSTPKKTSQGHSHNSKIARQRGKPHRKMPRGQGKP